MTKNLQGQTEDTFDIWPITFSGGWLQSIMARNGLCNRQCTKEAKRDPNQLVDKICAYIVKVKRLHQKMYYDLCNIVMDKTAIWNDMIANTTIQKQEDKVQLT